MDSGVFNVLHDSRQEDVLAVTDGVNFTLPSFQIGIDQDWMIARHVGVFLKVLAELIFVINDFHRLSPEDVARPN